MPQPTASNPTSTKAQRTRTRATAKRSRAPQSPPEALAPKPVEGAAAGYPPRRPKAAGPWQDAATAGQTSERAALTPTPGAEALLETVRERARARWLEWCEAHPEDVATESDAVGAAGDEIGWAVVTELSDEDLQALIGLPELWRADAQLLKRDSTLRGAARATLEEYLAQDFERLTPVPTPGSGGGWVGRTGPDDTRTFRERNPWIPLAELVHLVSIDRAEQLLARLKSEARSRLEWWERNHPEAEPRGEVWGVAVRDIEERVIEPLTVQDLKGLVLLDEVWQFHEVGMDRGEGSLDDIARDAVQDIIGGMLYGERWPEGDPALSE